MVKYRIEFVERGDYRAQFYVSPADRPYGTPPVRKTRIVTAKDRDSAIKKLRKEVKTKRGNVIDVVSAKRVKER